MDNDIDRRTFVGWTGAVTGAIALAGCMETGGDDEDTGGEDNGAEGPNDPDLPRLPRVEDPPNAVYVPTHRESMWTIDPITAGDYTIAPMLSMPHSFWILTGGAGGADEIQRVDPTESRSVHMMFTLWDAETGVVLPVNEGATITVSRDGQRVGQPTSPWPMLSQGMGFHFGDNVPLEADGTYTVEVDLPPLSVRTTGDLTGRFTEGATATFEFEYDDDLRNAVVDGIEYFDEEYWGQRGAIEPMGHGGGDDAADDGNAEIPYSTLPPADAYPGTALEPVDESATDEDGRPRSDDAVFVATLLESGSRLVDGDERYLLVSPRTPYNRVPLADMALNATVARSGERVADAPLEQTVDGEFALHYGASLADVRPGDSVTITVESPPQVARHQGYETAFLEIPSVELTVPGGGEQ
ncbi:DUF7350 domain-containing protein [Haloterrigena alkaliphila]|uniref:DUF7350 domain-containing protein n=1 Tax=Haloterrigena alkaliphila TaxID=2816475 RepID=A0A8A2VEM0_9EURY|nr:hypothetical protein [Haloterrigena alkaliphila]QSW98802.1 hypothetical protein J0X25_15630 [Haloterrigena alkaliphila]